MCALFIFGIFKTLSTISIQHFRDLPLPFPPVISLSYTFCHSILNHPFYAYIQTILANSISFICKICLVLSHYFSLSLKVLPQIFCNVNLTFSMFPDISMSSFCRKNRKCNVIIANFITQILSEHA